MPAKYTLDDNARKIRDICFEPADPFRCPCGTPKPIEIRGSEIKFGASLTLSCGGCSAGWTGSDHPYGVWDYSIRRWNHLIAKDIDRDPDESIDEAWAISSLA